MIVLVASSTLRDSACRLKLQRWMAEPEERAEMREKGEEGRDDLPGGRMSCIRKRGPAAAQLPIQCCRVDKESFVWGCMGCVGAGRGDWKLSNTAEQQLTSAPWGVPHPGLNSPFVTQD